MRRRLARHRPNKLTLRPFRLKPPELPWLLNTVPIFIGSHDLIFPFSDDGAALGDESNTAGGRSSRDDSPRMGG